MRRRSGSASYFGQSVHGPEVMERKWSFAVQGCVTEGVDGWGSVAGRQGRGLCPPAGGGGGGEKEPRRRWSSGDLRMVAAHPEGEEGEVRNGPKGRGRAKTRRRGPWGMWGEREQAGGPGGIGGARRGSSVDAAKKSAVARGDRCMLH